MCTDTCTTIVICVKYMLVDCGLRTVAPYLLVAYLVVE